MWMAGRGTAAARRPTARGTVSGASRECAGSSMIARLAAMRTPGEVLSEILGRIAPLAGAESVPLSHAPGRVLARDVVSDLDLPPFNKSAVDGFAVRAADFGPDAAPRGERILPVVGESRAGAPWTAPLGPESCVEI